MRIYFGLLNGICDVGLRALIIFHGLGLGLFGSFLLDDRFLLVPREIMSVIVRVVGVFPRRRGYKIEELVREAFWFFLSLVVQIVGNLQPGQKLARRQSNKRTVGKEVKIVVRVTSLTYNPRFVARFGCSM